MSLVKAAIGDAILTSLWVFTLPLVGILTSVLHKFLNFQFLPFQPLLLSIIIITAVLFIFSLLSNSLGGASFNPSTTLCLYAAGLKRPGSSLISLAVRIPAQAAGAVVGAKGIIQSVPKSYQHRLKGPILKTNYIEGAIAEGALTFVLCFVLMVIMVKGPKKLVVKVWLVGMVTLGLIRVGSGLTGPSLNPANAFGWAYVNDVYGSWGFYCVYWVGSLVGGVLAGLAFGFLFTTPAPKQKLKKKKA